MKIVTIIDNSFIVQPDTILLRNNDAYYSPSFTNRVEAHPYLLVKITRVTKALEARFANRCYDEVGVALQFVAVDTLDRCIKEKMPWDMALSYDKSTAVPNLLLPKSDSISFSIEKSGEMLFSEDKSGLGELVDKSISEISMIVTLKIGDMVMLPLSDSSFVANIGDAFIVKCQGERLLDFDVK